MSSRTGTALGAPAPVGLRKGGELNDYTKASTKDERRPKRARHDITVNLKYLKDDPLYDTVKPVQVTPPYMDMQGKTNILLSDGPTETLHDVRGREDQFTLEGNGFCYVNAPTTFSDWYSQPSIGKDYLPEMERLLRQEVEGCDEIVFYDARLRREGDAGARENGVSYNPFAKQVHLDNTPKSAIEKVRNTTDMKADYYLAGRVRMINIWRPVHHPVYDCGLAIADGAKLKNGDIIECDRVRADNGSYWDTMGVIKFKPHFDWYYMSQQEESDVLIFKNYDSAEDVPARMCMHTAFDVPANEIPENAPPRQSIEVRALVFTFPAHKRRPSGQGLHRPLESALAEGSHSLFEEEHSITHYLRTDIDEGKEVKDAMLLVRKQAQLRLAKACEAAEEQRDMALAQRDQAVSERDRDRLALQECEVQLLRSQQQVSILAGTVQALESKVAALQRDLQSPNGELHQHVKALNQELAGSRLREEQLEDHLEKSRMSYRDMHLRGLRCTDMSDLQHGRRRYEVELTRLQEYVDLQEAEITRWKTGVLGEGKKTISLCWQAQVDEAVRREREKDQAVLVQMTSEIEKLKAEMVWRYSR